MITENSDNSQTWGFIYRLPAKVGKFPSELDKVAERYTKENRKEPHIPEYFIHKSLVAEKKRHGVREVEEITPLGYIFLQGSTDYLKDFLKLNFPSDHLVNNKSTGKTAEIPDCQMQSFKRLSLQQPERMTQLDNPITYFKGHKHIRILSGILKGLEGYVVRVRGNRSLVMDFAGTTIAIKDILQEEFEVVDE